MTLKSRITAKPLVLLLVTICSTCLLSSFSYAASKNKASSESKSNKISTEDILPFGGLTWDDSIIEAVGKVKQISGLESFVLASSLEYDMAPINLKDKNSNEEIINAALSKHGPNEETYMEQAYDKNVFIFNAKGEKVFIYEGSNNFYLNVFAKPVVIAGIPFNMKVSFEKYPGVAIKNPDKALFFTHKGINFVIPYLVSIVELTTRSPILADKSSELVKLINDKYSKYDGKFQKNGSTMFGTVKDGKGNKFTLMLNKGSASITYKSENNAKLYKELYRKYHAELEQKQNNGKKDLGSQL